MTPGRPERSHRPHRDPDTGEIKINGKAGAFLAWMGFASRWLTLPLLVAILTWGLTHRDEHRDMGDFMEAGPRLTPRMLEQRLDLYKADVIQYVAENYPPQELLARVEDNSKALHALQVQVAVMDDRIVRMSTEMSAIHRLLEN